MSICIKPGSKKNFDELLKKAKALALTYILFLIPIITFAQQKITGVVTGTDNAPLSGATVIIKNKNKGVTTDANGYFNIAVKSGDVLIISFVGYGSKEIKVTDQSSLKVSLFTSVANLDDMVVTGYTIQKIKEITGSVATVKPKELTAIPAGQVEQMLQGRVAGLNVISSGLPGGPSNIRIHGIGNFGDITPLYIIDGIQGNINNLNPNDIESLQVLKDAGAYAVYGVRGANGVIIITTRSGKTIRAKVNYNFYTGVTVPSGDGPELLNPQEMADLTWLAYKNSGLSPGHPLYGNGTEPVLPDYFLPDEGGIGLSASDPRADPDLYNIDFSNGDIYQIVPANKTGTDWFHEVYKPAFKQSHSLTVSGANEKNRYLFSLV